MLLDEAAEPKALPLSLLEDITRDFSHDHEIGRGGFAVVYKGILGRDMAVAVKRLTDHLMDEMEFHREVECLMRVKHKNVVRFLGYCANRQGTLETYGNKLVMADVHQRLLCFEYVPQGSLHKYIIDAHREWGTCYRIIRGICEGLQYLHDNNIIHMDLKPANILLGNNMVPKIADFGLSRCFDENQSRHITKKISGTLGYLAPELVDGGVIARSADLYSLGVIINEILTGQKGYQDIGDVLESWSDRLERPQQDTLCEQIRVCYEIALECIHFSPKKRPASARNIIDRLHEMTSVQKSGFADDDLATNRKGVADLKNFTTDQLGSYDYEERRSWASYPRCENAQFVQSDLVGDQIKKNTEELEHKLIADGHHEQYCSSAVRVVAIVGQGGIGKSTLAKKVFASDAINEEFKIKIWLSVTQQFTTVDLLRTAIAHAGGEHCEDKQDKTLLVQALTDALSKKKFILVLDDVWNKQAWDHVLRVPVLNAGATQPGSRVLVTTRMEDVVRSMGASSILRVNLLGDEDAWCLLKKQLPQPQVGVGSDFDELKDIGMKIVKICDGLPLAIKVMGGLLSTRYPKEREWEIVLHKNLGWEEEDGTQEELNYSVRLSYDDLSPKLKQCFLYYSLLPKGSGFTSRRIASMWICEGFVEHDGRSKLDQVDLEQIGADYHRELVARNLLEPDDSNKNIWEYTLHDVVRSFAQFMAKEEVLVVHKDQVDMKNLLSENKNFCRLSIKSTPSELELSILEKQERLRTLLLIGCKIRPGGSLENFARLRVLDISTKECDWLVDSVCELRHLRYLSFSNTNISRLPDDIHKMRFLEHIHLQSCTELEKLPNNIIKLACLRYLNLRGSNVDVIPRGFGVLTDLTTLVGFPVKMDGEWCSLEELEALSHLRILSIEGLDNVAGSSVAKRAKISNKKNLEYLELNCYKDDEDEAAEEVRQIGVEQQERIEAVFDELCPPPARLETLIIERYFGRRLPNWLQSPAATTFKSLRDITLKHITHSTQLPDGLCRILGLEVVRIIDAPAIEHVGPDFQTHDAARRGDGGAAFPNLTRLDLKSLSEWKEWDWEDEEPSRVIAMPCLEFLVLRDCKLTHLPLGLASDRRHNLRTIVLWNLTLLEYVENFPWVVELRVYLCPELKRMSGFTKVRTVRIRRCPKLKLLEGVRVLDSIELDGEHWKVAGADERCTPKTSNRGYQQAQDALPSLLPQDLVITR
ncbi:Disease resistance protein RGA2 [Hordeum vulgare]|nr:Disease resistance protein RGA2 [Hordeum vulgare]